MGDKEHGHALCLHFIDARKALALKGLIADREGLIHNQNIGLSIDRHGKSQPYKHATRVGAHRLIHKTADISKGGDVIKFVGDFSL